MKKRTFFRRRNVFSFSRRNVLDPWQDRRFLTCLTLRTAQQEAQERRCPQTDPSRPPSRRPRSAGTEPPSRYADDGAPRSGLPSSVPSRSSASSTPRALRAQSTSTRGARPPATSAHPRSRSRPTSGPDRRTSDRRS